MAPIRHPRPGRRRAALAVLALLPLAVLDACAPGRPPRTGPAPASRPAAARDTSSLTGQHPYASDSCVARLPASVLTRRDTIYLHAFILDTAERFMLPQADLLAQRVAGRLLALLRGRRDSLPTGEPLIGWRNDIGGNVAVTAHRDGRATWEELLPPPYTDTDAVHTVARALALAPGDGGLLTWSREAGRDSLAIRLALDTHVEPHYDRGIGLGFPVFAQRVPEGSRPELLTHPPLQYPGWLRDMGVMGHVIIEAIIDTEGRAEPGSVRDLWPAGYPRLEGRLEEEYEAFVRAARVTVLGSRFAPGRLGSCPVRVRVEIPFNFAIDQ